MFANATQRKSKQNIVRRFLSGKISKDRVSQKMGMIHVSSDSLQYPKPILEQRGWVLQESALSIRRLRYLDGGLHWRCAGGTASEAEPMMKLFDDYGLVFNRRNPNIHGHPFINSASMKLGSPKINVQISLQDILPENEWSQLMWFYDRLGDFILRKLTFPKDKLPAILGLANAFSERTGYTFKCGIWLEDFRRSLLWRGSISQDYLAHYPSWSWAVIEKKNDGRGGIFLNYYYVGRHFNAQLTNIFLSDKYNKVDGACEVLTLHGYTRLFNSFFPGPTLYGLNRSNSLISPEDTRDYQLSETSRNSYPTEEELSQAARSKENPSTTPDLWLDTSYTPSEAGLLLERPELIVIRITSFREYQIWSAYYLLLEPVSNSVETYRRLGIMRVLLLDGRERSGSIVCIEPMTIDTSLYKLKTIDII